MGTGACRSHPVCPDHKEESMSLMNLSPAAAMTLVKSELLSGVLMTFAPVVVLGQQMEKKGTTPYVTHFIFRPLIRIDIPGIGTSTKRETTWSHPNIKR